MSEKDEVHAASKSFYAALNSMAKGDASHFGHVWSHGASVTTMHPIGGRETGWDQVRESFEQVARMCTSGHVELSDQAIHVAGDMAYEIGIEHADMTLGGQHVTGTARVTNVYHRHGGAWKIVHHHTDVSQPMLAALEKIKQKV